MLTLARVPLDGMRGTISARLVEEALNQVMPDDDHTCAAGTILFVIDDLNNVLSWCQFGDNPQLRGRVRHAARDEAHGGSAIYLNRGTPEALEFAGRLRAAIYQAAVEASTPVH